jgi:hypothetical protein
MPEISRFYGIIVRMYYADHYPPHFHAFYGDYEAIINIETLGIIYGKLPPKAHGLVIEWATLNQELLIQDWEKARRSEELDKIPPLE